MMKKWNLIVLLQTVCWMAVAGETGTADKPDESTITYLGIGLLILSLVVFILFNGQKRKFND